LQTNSYFAHVQNVLLGLLTDLSSSIQEIGLKILKVAMENEVKDRQFRAPDFNKTADSLVELLSEKYLWTPPPILSHLSFDEICQLVRSKSLEMTFSNITCHSKSVKRTVKLVTEASKSICGNDK